MDKQKDIPIKTFTNLIVGMIVATMLAIVFSLAARPGTEFSFFGFYVVRELPESSAPAVTQRSIATNIQSAANRNLLLSYSVPRNEATAANIKKAALWLNETCSPDRVGDVTGLFQEGRTANYNFTIYCWKGSDQGTDKTRLSLVGLPWSTFGSSDALESYLRNTSSRILGYYGGYSDDIVYVVTPMNTK